MKADNKYSAFDTAVYFLTFKDRTEKELRDKLTEKGYSDSEIDIAIAKLSDYGYINDAHYTFLYIKSNINNKGIKLISYELYKKGINRELICEQYDEYLESLACDETFDVNNPETNIEYGIVKNIFEKRFKGYDLNEDKNIRKIKSYFLRRGFKLENINKVMNFYM